MTLLLFIILGVAPATAQEPGDSRPLADKGSVKGRMELRREKRILRNKREYTRKNMENHVERDKTKGKYSVIKLPKWRKHKKEKNRSRKSGEKPKL